MARAHSTQLEQPAGPPVAPVTLRTLPQFAQLYPAFPVATLRWLRYAHAAPGQPFANVFTKIAGRVLVDEGAFFAAVAAQRRAA